MAAIGKFLREAPCAPKPQGYGVHLIQSVAGQFELARRGLTTFHDLASAVARFQKIKKVDVYTPIDINIILERESSLTQELEELGPQFHEFGNFPVFASGVADFDKVCPKFREFVVREHVLEFQMIERRENGQIIYHITYFLTVILSDIR